MSTTTRNVCARVVELASAMLDGRLDAARRCALQRHLQACAACTRTVQQLARLGRATHNLPAHRLGTGMGERVLASLQVRRQQRLAELDESPPARRREQRAMRVVAAAALLALAWSIGFWMRGPSTAGWATATRVPTAAAPVQEARAARPVEAPLDATFATTSRRVLSDLAWAPELPPHTRRPLFAAQLELFDLQRRAASVLAQTAPDTAEHELARLVADLARAFESTGSSTAQDRVDWQGWQRRAATVPTHTLAATPIDTGAVDSAAVARVVQHHAGHLTRAESDELGQFLQLKRQLVLGTGTVGLEFVSTWQQRATQGATAFTLATGFAGAHNLAEGGRSDAAADLDRLLREMLRTLREGDRPQR